MGAFVVLSQAEKLEALVGKAFENKWEGFGHCRGAILPWYIVSAGQMPTPKVVEKWVPKNTLLIAGLDDYYYVWEKVLFDKEGIARALFGEKTMEDLYREDGDEYLKVAHAITWISGYEWDYVVRVFELYLQGAVISKDPIGYMYKVVFSDD